MTFTAGLDDEFGDAHFDVSKNEKRLIRATLKTFVFEIIQKGWTLLWTSTKNNSDFGRVWKVDKNSKNSIGCSER